MNYLLNNPFFGIGLTVLVYGIGEYLYHKTNRFVLFQPLFFGMLLGIGLLVLIASALQAPLHKVYQAYQIGGDWLFWLVAPATVSFAVPLYKRNDIFKKHWDVILLALFLGLLFSLFGIYGVSRALNLTDEALGAMLVQAATTAIALPVAESVGGDQAIAAFAVILNSVLIYALGDHFIRWFKLHKNPLGAGLGFGIAGNAVGATKAIEVSEAAGATGAIAFVIAGILVNFMVPVFARLVGLG
ncbi:antiholin LrgB [Lactobacillus sp. CBA3605]|uniref:LrgB family protein n=1 Tax=Lactobacillus sp. CBA3605 TaxID=2099788 RepID=UPI000CFC2FCD|nr:LrgB family protein [Lactobacillus sp. CBA3605]AVK61292.1 antiholin LrgB [Lactobacillus sp. CBA3605]